MNTNSKRLGLYLAIMTVLTAIATSLRTVACIRSLDYSSGFFTDKSLITAANIIMTVTVLGMFSYLFVAARIQLIASFSTATTYVTTGVLGVATAFLGAQIISFASIASRYPAFYRGAITADGSSAVIGTVCAVLAFASIAHHFFNAFITESKTELRAYFAIATIAFLALYSMLIYLDGTLAIGESSKILRLIAVLLAALFFLYEARISLGREMWRIYTSFGLAAASICAYTSIPAIITYFVNQNLVSHSGRRSLASLEEYIFLFAMFIFIMARLFITVMLSENEENKYIKSLKDYANARDHSVIESYARYNKMFASKQLSIFDLYGGEIPVEDEEESAPKEEAEKDVAPKQPMISDDAIYESIFGKMPDKEDEPESDEEAGPEAQVTDEREAEEIADELLNSLDNAINNASQSEKETEI